MKSILVIIFILSATFLNANPPGEEENIVSVVQHFFTVMETRDTDEAKKILIPGGCTFSIRSEGKTETLKTSNFQEFINSLSTLKDNYKEAMSNPKILVHEGIAVLWTKYDFYINGKFSHCGVDAFSLIKTADGWKIAGLVYTVEKTGCTPQQR